MIEMAIMRTNRLVLRQFHIGDVADLAELFADPEVMRFGPGPQPRDFAERFCRGCLEDYHSKWGFGLWAIMYGDDRQMIGYCGLLVQEIEGRQEIELGYRLKNKFWGQGIATEAAQASRDYGFQELGLKRLISIIEPANVASIRVAHKNGMRLESETTKWDKSVQVYAVHRSELP